MRYSPKPPISALHYNAVSSMLKETGRVNHLIDHLLMLVRGDGNQRPANLALARVCARDDGGEESGHH